MGLIKLNNSMIAVGLDANDGGISSLTDLISGETTSLKTGFSVTALTGGGEVRFDSRSAETSIVSKTALSAEFAYEDEAFSASVRYTLPENDAFVERELSISRKDGSEWTLKSISCEKAVFDDKNQPNEIHMHDDQTIWHVPTNIFIRYGKGGLYCGLEYPYWDLDIDGTSGFTLGFTPNYRVKGGEAFTAEKTFWGVYRLENIQRYSHGPFPGAKKLKYESVLDFNDSGLPQDFADMKVPEDVGIPPEVLDWGEVWALQKFFAHKLPMLPLPEEGYWVWQNGWWGGLTKPDLKLLEPLEQSGVKDVLTAAMYLGHDSHPCSEPRYIRDVRIDPPGFPIYASGDDKGDTSVPTALHAEAKVAPEDEIIGYTDDFRAPKDYDEFIWAAREKGIYIESFETPNNFYRNRPEWLSVDKNGEPHKFFSTKLSCPACDEYMDFHFELFCRIIDKYQPRLWTLDGRWLSYSEYAGYGVGEIGEDPCYSDKHGHIPGDNRYKEWKNIEIFKERIRKRYPNLCLEQYYGLKRGGVWSMANLNSDENIYETGGPDDNRFQTWHNENSRFRPVYINYTSIMGKTPAEVEYSMLSSLSTSAYGQIAFAYSALRDYPEAREIFMRWREWGNIHHKYLTDRRCLFSYPGDKAVDGSAHIIGGEGYIFLFSPTENYCDARMPFNRLIGLDEDKNAVYAVEVEAAVRSDGEKAECSVPESAAYGDTLRLRISPKTALLISIKKKSKGIAIPLPDGVFKPGDVIEEAF